MKSGWYTTPAVTVFARSGSRSVDPPIRARSCALESWKSDGTPAEAQLRICCEVRLRGLPASSTTLQGSLTSGKLSLWPRNISAMLGARKAFEKVDLRARPRGSSSRAPASYVKSDPKVS